MNTVTLTLTQKQAETLEYFLADRLDDYQGYVMADPDDDEHAATMQDIFDDTCEVHTMIQAAMRETSINTLPQSMYDRSGYIKA